MKKQRIDGLINQEAFNWYQLSPTYSSILTLEELFNKIKSDNDPNFLAEQEGEMDYNKFIGAKWTYRYENGKIYCIIIILPKSIEVIAMKDRKKGDKVIEHIEKHFLKEW